MDISTDILYGLLSERYRLNRFGKGIRARELSLPLFWETGMTAQPGGIYVARTGDLPNRPPEDCLFICCGSRPPKVWNMWPCEIFYVEDARDDLLGIFNAVQRIIDRLVTWATHMQRLATSGSHIREMVQESIPIFNNRITVTDYELQILAYCELDAEHPEQGVQMSDRFAHLPLEKVPLLTKYSSAMRNREPFFAEEAGRGDNYCINLFLGDAYIGACSLQEDTHPLKPLELELFQMFAGFVRDALTIQSRSVGNQLVTARAVFEQLLSGFPVSSTDMTHALNLIELNLGSHTLQEYKWCCVVVQNSRRGKNLPESYITTAIEGILPNATALIHDESVVAFCLIRSEEHRLEEICDPLEAYLSDMGFKAGVSRTFRDPFHARSYYQQAICAMETGYERDPKRLWYLFGDYVLGYMLQSCCGDFETELVVAPELVRLHGQSSGGVDYVETLRAYLDNDCNASQTARAMFLHRSTLVQRLDKIREFVDLDDPDRRLYLRMCLHLPEIDQALEHNTDVV